MLAITGAIASDRRILQRPKFAGRPFRIANSLWLIKSAKINWLLTTDYRQLTFMCGIVGYVGKKRVVPVIIDGLRRLEYSGYDSAGIAVGGNGDGLQVRRAEGKLRNLEEVIRLKPLDGTYGIGHTRWATHGRPTEENAHPHRDCTGKIVEIGRAHV